MFFRKRLPSELLPCPFCGNAPSVREIFGKLSVDCYTKGCINPSTWLSCQTTSLEMVAQIWNRRPPRLVHADADAVLANT